MFLVPFPYFTPFSFSFSYAERSFVQMTILFASYSIDIAENEPLKKINYRYLRSHVNQIPSLRRYFCPLGKHEVDFVDETQFSRVAMCGARKASKQLRYALYHCFILSCLSFFL